MCLNREADREGCPTQALFEKQRKLRISPSSDTVNSAFTITFYTETEFRCDSG